MPLTFDELRTANLTRCARWHPGGIEDWDLADWAVAMAGEAGEVCNVVKKLKREADGIRGNAPGVDLRIALADELADVAIYLDLLAARAGIDLAAAIAAKFNHTSRSHGFPDRLPMEGDHDAG